MLETSSNFPEIDKLIHKMSEELKKKFYRLALSHAQKALDMQQEKLKQTPKLHSDWWFMYNMARVYKGIGNAQIGLDKGKDDEDVAFEAMYDAMKAIDKAQDLVEKAMSRLPADAAPEGPEYDAFAEVVELKFTIRTEYTDYLMGKQLYRDADTEIYMMEIEADYIVDEIKGDLGSQVRALAEQYRKNLRAVWPDDSEPEEEKSAEPKAEPEAEPDETDELIRKMGEELKQKDFQIAFSHAQEALELQKEKLEQNPEKDSDRRFWYNMARVYAGMGSAQFGLANEEEALGYIDEATTAIDKALDLAEQAILSLPDDSSPKSPEFDAFAEVEALRFEVLVEYTDYLMGKQLYEEADEQISTMENEANYVADVIVGDLGSQLQALAVQYRKELSAVWSDGSEEVAESEPAEAESVETEPDRDAMTEKYCKAGKDDNKSELKAAFTGSQNSHTPVTKKEAVTPEEIIKAEIAALKTYKDFVDYIEKEQIRLWETVDSMGTCDRMQEILDVAGGDESSKILNEKEYFIVMALTARVYMNAVSILEDKELMEALYENIIKNLDIVYEEGEGPLYDIAKARSYYYNLMGDEEMAMKYDLIAYEGYNRVQGENDPRTLLAMKMVASDVLYVQENPQKALEMCRDCYERMQKTFGILSRVTLHMGSLLLCAMALNSERDTATLDTANDLYIKCKEKFGCMDVDTLDIGLMLAVSYMDDGRLDAAATVLSEIKQGYETVIDHDSDEYAFYLSVIEAMNG